MFCSHCGAKIERDAHFCPKCGKPISKEEPKSDKDEKKPIPAEAKPQSSCLKSCGWTILIILLIVFLIPLFSSYSQIKTNPQLKYGFIIFGLFFVLIFGWTIFRSFKKSKEQGVKKNNIGATIATIIAILIIPLVVIIFYVGASGIKTANPSGGPTPKSTSTKTPSKETNDTNTTPQKVTSWDGNYNAQMTKPNCDSSVELTSFQVADNKVINLWGNAGPIDSDGHAKLIFDTGTTMTVNFTFSMSNNKANSNGTWSTSRGCSGTFQAIRSW